MWNNPSWGNAGWLAVDTIAVAIPIFGGVGAVGKGIAKVDNVVSGGKSLSRADDAAKSITNSPFKSIMKTMDPKDVRYSQDTIAQNLRSGENIDEVADKLRNGEISPSKIGQIRVVEYKNHPYTLDNRRLYILQKGGVNEINVQKLDMNNPRVQDRFFRKLSTENKGKKVEVRR